MLSSYSSEKRESVLALAGRFVRGFFCFVGFLTVLLLGVAFCKGFIAAKKEPVRPNTALNVSFGSDFYESRPTDLPTALAFGNAPTVADLTRALYRAAEDPNITALAAYLPRTDLSTAQVQEIRAAVAAFRAKGKKTVVFSPSFGDLGGGLREYYLASAFEEIRLQPTGEVGIAGFSVESVYMKKALEKWGVKPSFEARHEYKAGADQMAADAMSPAERENLTALMNDLLGQIAADIAADRKMPVERVLDLIKNGPYFADKALENGLIDKIEYADVLEKELKDTYADLLPLFDYDDRTAPAVSKKDPVFAYIPAVGIIGNGESIFGGDADSSFMGISTVSDTLRAAADDETVKALIVRLDSPGGAYTPSDSLMRDMKYVRQVSEKPIVCTVASEAASGGFFLTLGCDKVFALPASVTGSIGVFGGKIVFGELLDKLGVKTETVETGKNAGLFSATRDFTPDQKAFFNESLDRVYADFTNKVAERRGLTPEQTDAVARGRVFTGKTALSKGLIDGLGGLKEAVVAAAELAQTKELPLIEYPVQPTRFEMIEDFLMNGKMKISGVLPKIKMLLRNRFDVLSPSAVSFR